MLKRVAEGHEKRFLSLCLPTCMRIWFRTVMDVSFFFVHCENKVALIGAERSFVLTSYCKRCAWMWLIFFSFFFSPFLCVWNPLGFVWFLWLDGGHRNMLLSFSFVFINGLIRLWKQVNFLLHVLWAPGSRMKVNWIVLLIIPNVVMPYITCRITCVQGVFFLCVCVCFFWGGGGYWCFCFVVDF